MLRGPPPPTPTPSATAGTEVTKHGREQAVRRALAAAVLTASWARPDAAPAARTDVYALVGARIVTVSGATLESGTLVMRDGLIEAVGADGAVPPARQYPGSVMGTVAYVRQSLDDALRYRDQWAAYERSPAGRKRPRYDSALAAWPDVLAGRETLVVTAFRENDVRRALAIADE